MNTFLNQRPRNFQSPLARVCQSVSTLKFCCHQKRGMTGSIIYNNGNQGDNYFS